MNRALRASLFFWDGSAAVNPGAQLHGGGIVPGSPSTAPSVAVLGRPCPPQVFIFFSGMNVGDSWRRVSASLITAALRKLNLHMAIAPPHILHLLLVSASVLMIFCYQKGQFPCQRSTAVVRGEAVYCL